MQTEKRPFFGKYEVLDQLGEGGFGRVVRARHRILGRDFAVKQLAPGLITNEADYTRFTREAQAMARLDHPHIVRVYDADVESGFPYIAMEFVEGPNVEKLVAAEGPMPLDEVVRLGREMASALAHMHEHGIIHRDVKSSNILRRATDGAFFLTDFGLALQEGMARITTELTGSREFMSPEQTTGHAVPQSDQYGLGVVLFEALTGRKPFELEGTHEQALVLMLQRVLHEPPPPVSAFRAGVPAWLAELVARCLRKKPEERYPDMRAVEAAFRRESGEDAEEALRAALAAFPAVHPAAGTPVAEPVYAAPAPLPVAPPRSPAAVPPAAVTPAHASPVQASPAPSEPRRQPVPPAVWGVLAVALAVLAFVLMGRDGGEPRASEPPGSAEGPVAAGDDDAGGGRDEDGGDERADGERGEDEAGEGEPEGPPEDEAAVPPRGDEPAAAADTSGGASAAPPLALNPPPLPEPDEAAPAEGGGVSAEEAQAIVDSYLQAGGRGAVEQMYADRIRYYGRGTLSRAAVMQDKANYFRQWPERAYDRASDVTVEETADGVRVRFDYTFEVQGQDRGVRGEGWTELTLRREGDALRIVGENGGVRRRQEF